MTRWRRAMFRAADKRRAEIAAAELRTIIITSAAVLQELDDYNTTRGSQMAKALCDACGLPHPPMALCIDAQRATIRDLLLRCGSVDRCDCGAQIVWMTHATSRRAPYNQTGLIHFETCTGRYSKDSQKGNTPPK